jgi:hypothetical protein
MVKVARLHLSDAMVRKLLYDAARTCCVCRTPQFPVEVHHIDQDPSNNVEDNLIVICKNCHGEAHTKHSLSKNLTPVHLKYSKKRWLAEVAERSANAMLPSSNIHQAMWTFINHEKLPRLLKAKNLSFPSQIFNFLQQRKSIDQDGVPIFEKEAPNSPLATIYNHFDWDTSQKIHNMYMGAVDELITSSNPLELGALWTRTDFKKIVTPGSLCFAMRGFKFRRLNIIDREETRFVYARARGIEIRFHANTRHMFGDSALYSNFVGNNLTAVLLLAKNLEIIDGNLVLHSTPIAMGAGFLRTQYHSPHKLRYGWTENIHRDVQNIPQISSEEMDNLW